MMYELSLPLVSHAVYAIVLFILLRLTRPVYAAMKKRSSGYGIVFDSVTGDPIPLATVRLVDLHGLPVSSAITDTEGRYHLAASKGEYYVDVVKDGYIFPSQLFNKKSAAYTNTLPTHHIKVKDYGMITKNIPVDPEKTSWSFRELVPKIRLSANVQFVIAYVSPLVLIAYPYMSRTPADWVLYGGYVIIVLRRIFSFKPDAPAFGVITDRNTNKPLKGAVVRIFESKYNKLRETQITSPRGRYAFVVRPGSYYVMVQKPGYRAVRINFPNINREGFVLSKSVGLKPLPPRPKSSGETTVIQPEQMTKFVGQFEG